ncbi:G-D-S-L family lipolytic protein [Scytonema hofmannii PCC 7110]|uniref:G-D-S-L family lipolytic protein n=1 Tax=Scytonema hofmannii PCC 7110 TaxID=128403 RepID=A0A139WRE4_9CYAN|nr:SGNH/GDSL hydrolase family protein [Scytonema hofmannii]KYC35006.1 G-D-S-L family lipolytic protein [Scytonema hofmannii PCC 7110]
MERKKLSHEEAVREVYRLTPQIREYDEFMYLGVRWLPYTMFFHHKNYQSEVISTDSFGFRNSTFGGAKISVANMPTDRPVNLLVGGSTTLGTGATSDANTISSRLAEYTQEPWLNFSGRGYNATQEIILFLMHQHRFQHINNVVVFSGINTLTLEGLPDNLTSDHGRYYYSFEYNHYMDKYNDDLKQRIKTYASDLDNRNKNPLRQLKSYISSLVNQENIADKIITDDSTNTQERVQRAAFAVSNALYQWQQVIAPFNARLIFILQPMSYWTRDYLTPNEEEIFHAIDSCPNNFWRLFKNILSKEIHEIFVDAIRTSCVSREIQFEDMNLLLRDSQKISDYLFVDRVHFNDEGYDEVANIIHKKVLQQPDYVIEN